jgi:ABC-type transport system involved in multi-copper enzyme maturation permease subunit
MINPVYWLELRIRACEKRLWIIALFFIITLIIVSGVTLASVLMQSSWTTVSPAHVGNGLIWSALFCQAGLLVILAPLATAGRISQEREQRTLPALSNSTLSASRIAFGKLFGAWTFVFWLAMLALPFLFAGSLWGGPGVGLILACVGINLVAGLTLSTISLGLSGIFGRSLTTYLVTGAFLFGWIVVVPIAGMLGTALNPEAGRFYREVVAFLTWYHHPFFPLSTLAGTDWGMKTGETVIRLVYALAVWTILGLTHLGLAVKGLKREVY